MKNFFSIFLLTASCLTTLNLCADQQEQSPAEFVAQLAQKVKSSNEALKEKQIIVMQVLASLLQRAKEENNAEILHNIKRYLYKGLKKKGFSKQEAAEYAFGPTENN